MLHITKDTRILALSRVIRVYNGRPKGGVIHYSNRVKEHELILKWSGASISTLGSQSYDLAEGAVLYLPKGFRGEYQVETLRQGESIDIVMDLNAPLADVPTLLPPPHRPALRALFAACHEAWSEGSSPLAALGQAYAVLAELQGEAMARNLPPSTQQAWDAVLSYLSQHWMDAKLDLSQVAAAAQLSYSYMKRLCIQQWGMPPSRYVTLRRMELARDLLSATEEPISRISQSVGYSSVYYFCRVFRRENGMTPTEYRRQRQYE